MKKLIVLLCGALPLLSSAQSKFKEFYGRPSYWRPYDQKGVNVFETTKAPDTIPFEGLRIRFGAGFTMQYQNLKHENSATNNTTTKTDPKAALPQNCTNNCAPPPTMVITPNTGTGGNRDCLGQCPSEGLRARRR